MGAIVGTKGSLRLLVLSVAHEAVIALGKVMMQAAKEILSITEEAIRWATMGSPLEAEVLANVTVGVLVIEDVVPENLAWDILSLESNNIPSIDKVNGQAVHDGAGKADADVGPAHSRVLGTIN